MKGGGSREPLLFNFVYPLFYLSSFQNLSQGETRRHASGGVFSISLQQGIFFIKALYFLKKCGKLN